MLDGEKKQHIRQVEHLHLRIQYSDTAMTRCWLWSSTNRYVQYLSARRENNHSLSHHSIMRSKAGSKNITHTQVPLTSLEIDFEIPPLRKNEPVEKMVLYAPQMWSVECYDTELESGHNKLNEWMDIKMRSFRPIGMKSCYLLHRGRSVQF